MCGIAGYIVAKDDPRTRTAISILALAMEDRGKDSWGMFYGNPKSSIAVHRVALAISDSFDLPEKIPLAMAVHTRHATTGKIKQGNSHPFTWKGTNGTVIGMHNGIISNHASVGKAHKRTYKVDSEHIFAHIAEGKDLSDLEGYGTIVYTQNNQWHIGKFNGGELEIVETEIGLFFCSTSAPLRLALRLAGLTILRWINTLDGLLYGISPKGLETLGETLNVQTDLFCGKWDDYDLLDPRLTTDIPYDDDTVLFISSGEQCEECGEPTDLGSNIYWVVDTIVCEDCYTTPVEKGKK